MAVVDQATSGGPSRARRTIVFVDIVDYSGLTRRLGDLDTVRVLSAFYEHADSVVRRFDGSILKQMGDLILAVFADTANAILFATEFQLSATRGDGIFGLHGLKMRIGVNTGDVYTETRSYGEDIFGVAVNIAANITALAEPGQIVVSHSAAHAIPRDGKLTLKGIERHHDRGSGEGVEISRLEVTV